jgi:hypothetical protein
VYAVYLVNSNILTDPSSDNWPYAINLKLINNIWISFKFFVAPESIKQSNHHICIEIQVERCVCVWVGVCKVTALQCTYKYTFKHTHNFTQYLICRFA